MTDYRGTTNGNGSGEHSTANKNFQQPSERQRRTATAKSQVAQHSMIFAAAVGSKGPKVRKDLDGPNGKHRQVAAVK
jgi:hypothetical protein